MRVSCFFQACDGAAHFSYAVDCDAPLSSKSRFDALHSGNSLAQSLIRNKLKRIVSSAPKLDGISSAASSYSLAQLSRPHDRVGPLCERSFTPVQIDPRKDCEMRVERSSTEPADPFVAAVSLPSRPSAASRASTARRLSPSAFVDERKLRVR